MMTIGMLQVEVIVTNRRGVVENAKRNRYLLCRKKKEKRW